VTIVEKGAWIAALLLLPACHPSTAIGGPVSNRTLHDGVYRGSFENINRATVAITVEGGRIVHVELVVLDASPVGMKAKAVIPRRIVEEQSTYVDVVSGASEASRVIMNATEIAVQASEDAASHPGR
jgi:uncharacterized protein with FMN-binding domain